MFSERTQRGGEVVASIVALQAFASITVARFAVDRGLFAFLASIIIATPAAAQNVTFRWTSFDVTVGASYGWGGEYRERPGIAGEFVFVPQHTSPRIWALMLGGRGSPVGNDRCDFSADGTHCLQDFPGSVHLGLLAGIEDTTAHATFRAMAGPAAFVAGAKGAGLVARVDAAAGARHIKFLIAATGALDVGPHEPFTFGMLMFGLRLH